MKKIISGCKYAIASLVAVFAGEDAQAQTRLTTHSTIGWYNTFHTVKVNDKWSVLGEYQWRRTHLVKNWQQSLFRVGVQRNLTKDISVLAGYGWIETFPYGDYPPAAAQPFPEHRIYEQLVINDVHGRVAFNHRFRYEQRWLGLLDASVPAEDKREITDWQFLQRVRYQFRTQIALNNPTMTDNTIYASVYDELFIGFGGQILNNIFDQNRVGIMAGYRLNKRFSVEAGFLSQIVQQARPVSGSDVYQHNNGFILNTIFNWN
ncbi:DUF2490 domain-containing protein [Chitinophaga horti]|uniref:DUF2490 domain-containing protein n=1 Tax=Chitinophaga horti TaxID=2920382 RepID=A0ABY6J3W1_9BACT|nr:DUF2490 domain-containing protein [Chitinophaga horti]UYQ94355.1 DUF2490 domain-containing protein [Chitinophaga horti]